MNSHNNTALIYKSYKIHTVQIQIKKYSLNQCSFIVNINNRINKNTFVFHWWEQFYLELHLCGVINYNNWTNIQDSTILCVMQWAFTRVLPCNCAVFMWPLSRSFAHAPCSNMLCGFKGRHGIVILGWAQRYAHYICGKLLVQLTINARPFSVHCKKSEKNYF